MPYIKKSRRQKLIAALQHLDTLLYDEGDDPGELNYVIFSLILSQFTRSSCGKYKTLNRLVGVLQCVLNEFYHRHAIPYEKSKIKSNGDVQEIEVQVKELWKQ